ncbi:FAD-dependent oxidoreductase [Flavobacterium sp. DG1-102-2]|uniref:FAD-dependent oxidoreductase n=1 Tax=Flavobacterium sp. DG1-102-2 TaxID=3081663 RepID=UPI002948F31D|nr:FAD-dependent oxidoreductase [Flavobacterium sp. DG1-102-2]MDV6167159.1 FAD-dependent oxidoreductase [Flavobacterium sp. DG1-102-2]
MDNQDPINDKLTSGHHHSYWNDSQPPLVYKTLESDAIADVLIVGGGIAGLTTAYCLSKSGKTVVLLEDGYLGSGETGRTTAQITYALDDRYYDLEKFFGQEKAKLVAESHRQALDWIQGVVAIENIDCNFKTVDGYLFTDPSDKEINLDKELEATRRAGLPTEMVTQIPGMPSGKHLRAIKFPGQGQFHITRYLKGLADAVIAMGGEIYTDTHVDSIDKNGAKAKGFSVKANHIVVATNSPVNDILTMHTKQFAYRTYVIAAKIPKGILPYAMWWDTGNQDSKWVAKPYHYVRLEPLDDNFDLLISGGEDHKTGMADQENVSEEERYNNLISWTKQHFPYFSDIAYKWSGQVMEPVDSLAFIGKNPGDENIYIITGDSGNGMTHCTLGGLIINDIIMGNPNPYIELYDPARITLRTGVDFLKEVGNMAYTMAKDWIVSGDIKEVAELGPNKGAIISRGLEKVAVYKDADGSFHTCSAVCPHLGGVLQWNDDEKSFDCPLHGSRFTAYGTVINGPAITDLKKII